MDELQLKRGQHLRPELLTNRGTMVLPAELLITFADGTTETVRLPVEMWNLGQRFMYRLPSKKAVRQVDVDARRVLPDYDRSNNRWTKPPNGA